MAEILGVTPQFERVRQLQNSGDSSSEELLTLKTQLLQKVLIGFVEVRRASDRNFREVSYAFDIMQREQRKQDLINQLFTLVNFGQLSTLYTMEPFLRLHEHFKSSAICTQVSGGLSLGLPVLSILQQKTARVKHLGPPEALQNIVTGGPVDASGMPKYVARFFDTPAPGSSLTRKDELFALCKKRYGVDPSRKETLCSLCDGKSQKMELLRTRILLLFELRTYILQMDGSLLALVQQIAPYSPGRIDPQADNAGLAALGSDPSRIESARLLNIQSEVAQLVSLNKSNAPYDINRQRLEVTVLERVLAGALEVRVAVAEIDAELNYASDVVLSSLIARRRKALQLNYEANFIQAGTLGSIAGLLYLKGQPKAGNEMFIISGGIGTGLSTLALRLMRGGTRKIDTNPNTLADVFDFRQRGEYRFSPLISNYLNSCAPDSQSKSTRREKLLQYWKQHKVTTVNLNKPQTLENLAAMPDALPDTIKIVTNRISMLHKLEAQVESFDPELLSLMRATEPADDQTTAVASDLPPFAAEAANLIGAQSLASNLRSHSLSDPTVVSQRLLLVRKVFTTALDVRSTEDVIDGELSYEYDVLGSVTRGRNYSVAITNNVNFYQLNILSPIINGPLGLSGNKRWVRASNILNIVSGLAVGSLAGMTVLEQHGGKRPLPVYPNMIGQCLGLAPPGQYRFSPVVWKFINEVPPNSTNGRTRVQQMMVGWKQAKTIYVNMDKESTREKVAAYGPAHTKHSESIKLIKNRLNMLYDVDGIVGLMNRGLDELLLSVS